MNPSEMRVIVEIYDCVISRNVSESLTPMRFVTATVFARVPEPLNMLFIGCIGDGGGVLHE